MRPHLFMLGLVYAVGVACRSSHERPGGHETTVVLEPPPSYGFTPVPLRESILLTEDRLSPGRLAIAGGRLFVLNPYAEPHVFVIDQHSGAVKCAFGRSGGGPGEFRFPESIAVANEGRIVWIGDPNQPRISMIPVDSACVAKHPVTITIPVTTPSFRGLAALDLHEFLVHDVTGNALFLRLDERGTIVAKLGLATALPGVPLTVAGLANQQSFAIRPKGQLIAAAGVRTGSLRFYGMDGDLRDTVATPIRYEPRFRVGTSHDGIPSMIPDSNDHYAYIGLAASDSNVLALFSGKRRGTGNITVEGRDLHVFDWSGCLIEVYRLEQAIGALAIDWESLTLYGSRIGADPAVVVVQLPAFGPCHSPK